MLTGRENNMQITPEEIDTIEEAGMLDGSPVRLIRTKGGFWICVGKPKGKYKEEALAAGSHPAIVKYNVEKQHPNFQPALMKSENAADTSVVDKHSHFLSEELLKSGHDVFSVQNGPSIEFQVTKYNMKTASVIGILEKDVMILKNSDVPKEFAHAFAGATAEKAVSCGVSKVKFQGK